MRFVLALFLTATPALGWEFSPKPICTLSDNAGDVEVRVTYDPASRDYAIALTRSAPWPGAPLFAIRFDGPRGLTISTTRQILSNGGRTLTVTDKGFGNVLNGIEFNETATALAGNTAARVPLAGAAPHVRAFRACATGGLA